MNDIYAKHTTTYITKNHKLLEGHNFWLAIEKQVGTLVLQQVLTLHNKYAFKIYLTVLLRKLNTIDILYAFWKHKLKHFCKALHFQKQIK